MNQMRKKHSPAFKAKVALAALKGDQTMAQLASQFRGKKAILETGLNRGAVTRPELGVLLLALTSEAACSFRASPARSLHAALLRRLELVRPEVAAALHDSPRGSSASDHPWTISMLMGPLGREGTQLQASPSATYRVRVTGLATEVLEALATAFDQEDVLGREPLVLEHVPFHVVAEESRWEEMATYPSLLTRAQPNRRVALLFRSPTAFRSRHSYGLAPPPRLCVEGYLRKWNAFSSVPIQERPVLEYAE